MQSLSRGRTTYNESQEGDISCSRCQGITAKNGRCTKTAMCKKGCLKYCWQHAAVYDAEADICMDDDPEEGEEETDIYILENALKEQQTRMNCEITIPSQLTNAEKEAVLPDLYLTCRGRISPVYASQAVQKALLDKEHHSGIYLLRTSRNHPTSPNQYFAFLLWKLGCASAPPQTLPVIQLQLICNNHTVRGAGNLLMAKFLSEARNQGYKTAVLEAADPEIPYQHPPDGYKELTAAMSVFTRYLNVKTYLVCFYERWGFRTSADIYVNWNCFDQMFPYVTMSADLPTLTDQKLASILSRELSLQSDACDAWQAKQA